VKEHDRQGTFILSDLALARRLERADAQGNLEFVEARAKLFPDSGAEWLEVGGAYAMYDGVDKTRWTVVVLGT
jgi:regulator of sirC expression with transglutaminase-like and TPR domain